MAFPSSLFPGTPIVTRISIVHQVDPQDKTTTQIRSMKTIKPCLLNRRTSGNGHSRGNGHTKPGRIALAGTAATQKNSAVGYRLTLVETEPVAFTIQIVRGRRQPGLKSDSPWLNLTQFDRPAFPMNSPSSYGTGCANNPWMKDLKGRPGAAGLHARGGAVPRRVPECQRGGTGLS